MLLFFIMMSWVLSLTFIFLQHPLSLGFVLLLQTITISISFGFLNFDYWFSYILFLIMIGGMLVLFIYMTSVASNEKFKFSKKLAYLISLSILITLMISLNKKYFFMMDTKTYDLMNQSIFNINLSMNKYMNMPCMIMMIILMAYLLITLIAIVKITYSKKGPLRQKNF